MADTPAICPLAENSTGQSTAHSERTHICALTRLSHLIKLDDNTFYHERQGLRPHNNVQKIAPKGGLDLNM